MTGVLIFCLKGDVIVEAGTAQMDIIPGAVSIEMTGLNYVMPIGISIDVLTFYFHVPHFKSIIVNK